MADPSNYTPATSFSDFQNTAPTTPLPAGSLDTELAAISASIQTLVDAVKDVRRSDGLLKNAIVGIDQITAALQAAIAAGRTEAAFTDINPASIADQPTAEAGVDSATFMTPLRVKQAVDAQRPIAAPDDLSSGSSVHVVTAAGVVEMLEDRRAFADAAEAVDSANTTTILSPSTGATMAKAVRPAFVAVSPLAFPTLAAGVSSSVAVTVTGAREADVVLLGAPASGVPAGCFVAAWVSADDEITASMTNTTAGSVSPDAVSDWRIIVLSGEWPT